MVSISPSKDVAAEGRTVLARVRSSPTMRAGMSGPSTAVTESESGLRRSVRRGPLADQDDELNTFVAAMVLDD
jgi:hypothetical protein